jgi:hypothetical protein
MLLIIVLLFQIEAASLKKVKEFDTGTDDFLFQRISSAVLSKNKDIYVTDGRGNFVARFDWNGKLIKKIGQFGQGPSDFNFPANLNIYGDKLFIMDKLNFRIVEIDLDLDLKTVKYHRLQSGEPFASDFFIIGKEKCIGSSISYSIDYRKEYKRIKMLDFKTTAEEIFFDKMPVKDVGAKDIAKNGRLFFYFQPVMGIDRENKNVVVSFLYPNNPIEFFVYSFDGECVDQFSYKFDETYKYPEHFRNGTRPPRQYTALIVYSIFVYKDHYIAMVTKNRYKGKREFDQDLCFLIFDGKSKQLKHRLSILNYLDFYSISEDGYLLGTRNYQDDVKVHVYKLEL